MVLIRARIQYAQDETNTVALSAFYINLGRIPFLAKSFRDRSRFARMPSGERACIPVGEPLEDGRNPRSLSARVIGRRFAKRTGESNSPRRSQCRVCG